MRPPEASKPSWLERLLIKMAPQHSGIIRDLVGDPHPPDFGVIQMGSMLAWRSVVVLPLVTIPTYLHLTRHLHESYAPEAASIGFGAWLFSAITYAVILCTGGFLHRKRALGPTMARILTTVALIVEVLLSSFYAYLVGANGGAHYVTGTLSVIMLMHRLFLNYRFGLLSCVISLIACTVLVVIPHYGAPISPLQITSPGHALFGFADLTFAYTWCTTVFLGCNGASNRVHRLRATLEVAHDKLGELNQFITESVLNRYLPPSLIQQIMDGEVSMDEQAKMKTVTILFSDLKDFTAISEKLGPKEIGKLLNDYFSTMNEVIFEHGGTIDKFIGDAIMVFFGAPKDLGAPEQARQAAACGHAMQARMRGFAERWATTGAGNVSMRIGIHQGEAVVGNFGSTQRMDYTCIGPAVNLASRIESAAEPGQVFVSQSVARHLDEALHQRVGSFQLKGIQEEQELYRVLG